MIAIAIVYTPIFARIMRGPVLAEREKEYVEAVRALGAGRVKVALRHVLPNVLSPFVVQGTVAFSQAILIEASLSYLGLSAQPPTPSWGNMLNEGRTYLETAPWISVFPGPGHHDGGLRVQPPRRRPPRRARSPIPVITLAPRRRAHDDA